MLPIIGNHIDSYTPKKRRKKTTRSIRREALAGKKRTSHGGRGRKYGLKGGRKQKKTNIVSLIAKLGGR